MRLESDAWRDKFEERSREGTREREMLFFVIFLLHLLLF